MAARTTPLICPPLLLGSTQNSVFMHITGGNAGLPTTGLLFSTAGLVASYCTTRSSRVLVPLVNLPTLASPFVSGGFKEIDPLAMPGWYRIDLPDAIMQGPPHDVIFTIERPGALLASGDYGAILMACYGGTFNTVDQEILVGSGTVGQSVDDIQSKVDEIVVHFPPPPAPTTRTDS